MLAANTHHTAASAKVLTRVINKTFNIPEAAQVWHWFTYDGTLYSYVYNVLDRRKTEQFLLNYVIVPNYAANFLVEFIYMVISIYFK